MSLVSNPEKKRNTNIGFLLFLLLCTLGLSFAPLDNSDEKSDNQKENTEEPVEVYDSILLMPWNHWNPEFGGTPPWRRVNPDEFLKAFDEAFSQHRSEIDAMVAEWKDTKSELTFESVMERYEQSGQTLSRLQSIFGVHASNLAIGDIEDIEATVMPKLSEHFDEITQNQGLFEAIEAVYKSKAAETLRVDQKRLLEKTYKEFVRKGAKLSAEDKNTLKGLNASLALLYSQFGSKVSADESDKVTWIQNEKDLLGIPENIVESLEENAVNKKPDDGNSPGRWAVVNTRSSMDPVLRFADNRELREKVWNTYYNRGDNGDENDTNETITKILKLRLERAKLLGYKTHAHWRLEPQMAANPENAMDLMLKVWPKAVERVKEEVKDMQEVADKEGAQITIEPWDYRYYAEKVRKERYDLDFTEVTPYMQLDNLRDGMMWVADKLWGLKFREVKNVQTFHPDVETWVVERLKDDGSTEHVGLWYFDPYARTGKRSGAWMTAYRVQQNLGGRITPLVSNNSNFVKASGDEPTLISWDDAVTLFHEFGHALHGLLSQVHYPSQAGTNVARDYVEFPSQLIEHWLSTPEVLEKFAIHHETGKNIPQELLDKIEKAAKFNQGFATVEYLSAAIVDMKLHLHTDGLVDPDAFEKEALKEIGMPKEVVMRHRTPQFNHLFTGDGYSAGYYSYLWADALTADAAEAFIEAGTFYDEKLAKSLLDNILSVGNTIDAAEGFRRFRGRNVDTDALLRKKGFQ